jgi:NodT family efflux transporter outer membrane factor (OMF) lipoprotein
VTRVLLIALLLGGCTAVGPNYTAPDTTMPESFARAPKDNMPTADTVGDISIWWQRFGDPELTALVERGLQQNLDLEMAIARIDTARARLGQARTASQPNITVNASAAGQQLSTADPQNQNAIFVPGFDRTQDVLRTSLDASWELDLFGRVRRSKEAAQARLDAVTADAAATRVSVAAAIAELYWIIRDLESRIVQGEARLDAQAKLVQSARAQFRRGLTDGELVAREQAQLDDDESAVARWRGDDAIAREALALLLDTNADTLTVMMGTHAVAPPVLSAVDPGMPHSLLRRRPDVLKAERELAAANAEIGVAMADYYPTISFGTTIGVAAAKPGDLVSGRAVTGSFGPRLSWNLLNFGRVDAEVATAKGLRREALIAFRKSVAGAASEVETQLAARVSIAGQITQATSALAQQQNILNIARARYAKGITNYDPVARATRDYITRKIDLSILRRQDAAALIALYKALGGGWPAA